MQVTITKPEYFKNAVDVLGKIGSEFEFSFAAEGMKLFVPDDSKSIIMSKTLLEKGILRNYKPEDKKYILLYKHLKRVFKGMTFEEVMILDFSDDVLTITIQGKHKKVYEISLLEEFKETVAYKEIGGYKADFDLPVEFLIDLQVSMLEGSDGKSDDDTVTIEAEGSKLTFRKTAKTFKSYVEFGGINAKEKVSSKFAGKYLSFVFESAKVSDTCKCKLGASYPLYVVFTRENAFTIETMIAPRVDNE